MEVRRREYICRRRSRGRRNSGEFDTDGGRMSEEGTWVRASWKSWSSAREEDIEVRVFLRRVEGRMLDSRASKVLTYERLRVERTDSRHWYGSAMLCQELESRY